MAEGTLIPTPAGAVAIETLRVGDPVWSVSEGEIPGGNGKGADRDPDGPVPGNRRGERPDGDHPGASGDGGARGVPHRPAAEGWRSGLPDEPRGAERGPHPFHPACPG
ncbi:MAG: Hint domain-containing protein [Candidatus Moduliflexus flocculans]|nr:Hint domain-containing protein [Candidatus Moduliflexus flocculans]